MTNINLFSLANNQNSISSAVSTTPLMGDCQARAYAGEAVGGFGVAGMRHEGAIQDIFCPSSAEGLSPAELSVVEMWLKGRLYLFADGVTLCADGRMASQLAVKRVKRAYYAPSEHLQEASGGLIEAVWQAHQRLQQWDGGFFCWRKKFHPAQQITHQEARWRNGQALCPSCGHALVGLQSTLVAILLRGRNLTCVAVGNSVLLRLPVNPGEPFDFIFNSKEKQFLGQPGLSHHDLQQKQMTLRAGDRLLLCGRGVIETLEHWQKVTGKNWQSALHSRLRGPNLQQATQELIEELHTFRYRNAPHLAHDLTLLVVAIPEAAIFKTLRNQMRNASDARHRLTNAAEDQLVLEAYKNLTNALEAFLLHEQDTAIWNQYGMALRQQAVAQMSVTGALNHPDARALMAKAVQVGDRDAARWLKMIEYGHEIINWRENKSTLLSQPTSWHEQVANTLMEINLVDQLQGSIIVTLRNSLKRLIKKLNEIHQPDAAMAYTPLFEKTDVNFKSASSPDDSTDVPTAPITYLAAGKPSPARAEKEVQVQVLVLDASDLPPEPSKIGTERLLLRGTPERARFVLRNVANLIFVQDGQNKPNLAEAVRLIEEVASTSASTNFYILREAWQTLWHDPDDKFELFSDLSSTSHQANDVYSLAELAHILSIADEVNQIVQKAATFHPQDEQIELAKHYKQKLARWPKETFEALPAEMALIPYTVAYKLASARYDVSMLNRSKRAVQHLQNEPTHPPSPLLQSARKAYAEVMWPLFFSPHGEMPNRADLLRVLNEDPWLRTLFPSVAEVEKALKLNQKGQTIEAAYAAVTISLPEETSQPVREWLLAQQTQVINEIELHIWQTGHVIQSWRLRHTLKKHDLDSDSITTTLMHKIDRQLLNVRNELLMLLLVITLLLLGTIVLFISSSASSASNIANSAMIVPLSTSTTSSIRQQMKQIMSPLLPDQAHQPHHLPTLPSFLALKKRLLRCRLRIMPKVLDSLATNLAPLFLAFIIFIFSS